MLQFGPRLHASIMLWPWEKPYEAEADVSLALCSVLVASSSSFLIVVPSKSHAIATFPSIY